MVPQSFFIQNKAQKREMNKPGAAERQPGKAGERDGDMSEDENPK